MLTIASQYEVWTPEGTPVMYVERPTYVVRTVLAYLLAAVAAAVVLGAVDEVPLLSVLLAAGVFMVVSMSARPRRHVTVYRDDSRAATLLRIVQNERIALLTRSYTVLLPDATPLARLRKHYLHNLVRKRWYAEAPGGEVLAVAMEDSIVLSLLRRVLGTLFGVLRTNFVIHRAHGGDVIGEFNRKFTLRDRYVLDMTADPDHSLDRRIAFALGVMLDSGERR